MKKVLLIMLLSVTLFASMFEDNKKACDDGDAISCAILGVMYDLGKEVRQNRVRAKEFYLKACDGGEMGSCTNLGSIPY